MRSPRRGPSALGFMLWLYPMEGRGRKASRGEKMGGKGKDMQRLGEDSGGGRDARGARGNLPSILHRPPPSPHTHPPLFRPPCNPALTFPTEVANLQECK